MERSTLLFDADCGFCRWSTDRILAWDRRRTLRAVSLQSNEAARLLPGMERERMMASWHLMTHDGRVLSAGAAVAPLARLLPAGAPVAALAAAFPAGTERAYQWVARHRDGFGRALGADACRVDPERQRP